MRKKFMTIAFASAMAISIVACGGETKTEEKQEVAVETTTEAQEEAEEVATTEAQATSDEAEVVDTDEMYKEPTYTKFDLGITGNSGAVNYSLDAIQVSKVIPKDDLTAMMFDVDAGTEVALVAIDYTVENTVDENMNFYIDQSKLTTNTKEQVDNSWGIGETTDGEFLGAVKQNGTLMFVLKNSNAEDVEKVTLYIDGTSNGEYETVGEDVVVEIPTK